MLPVAPCAQVMLTFLNKKTNLNLKSKLKMTKPTLRDLTTRSLLVWASYYEVLDGRERANAVLVVKTYLKWSYFWTLQCTWTPNAG